MSEEEIEEKIFAHERAEIETRAAELAEATRQRFRELGMELKDYSNRRYNHG